MKSGRFLTAPPRIALAIVVSALIAASAVLQAQDSPANPLPSWNDTAARQVLIEFVRKTTTPGSPDFVPVPERIATFDNDGTLWCEQPVYVQLEFALFRIQSQAPHHPDWKTQEPFASVLRGDRKGLAAVGEHGLMELVAATHTGVTVDEFNQIVADWIAQAKHPQTGRLYRKMVYQPMLELLAFLRVNGFKTYIVSGGGIEFMRPWAESVYGIPPEQVIGSYGQLEYAVQDGQPVLRKLPKIGLIDDGPGKPVGIQTFIGRRPVLAFGNSDGDFQMLEWTTAGRGPRLGLILHHTDAEREYAYDRASRVGRLDKALEAAPARGWAVVDMKKDWNQVFLE